MNQDLNLRVEVRSFDRTSFHKLLKLKTQHFVVDAWKQLEYLRRYLSDPELACKSLIIEHHYIDRDYIEDYSIFYSRSLYPFDNYCRRLHFFSLTEGQLRKELHRLVRVGQNQSEEVYREACLQFSNQAYLGFSVIKPLDGCPVGRTVLKCFGEHAGKQKKRQFQSTRNYRVHVAGVELTVRGLAFQQQDVGVSACATTALWTSLHKARDMERMGAPTPAQITLLASRHALPFGRSMPSEGLSIDQMCQAIQAVGVAPNLIRAEDFDTARSYLYSAARSGFAPILVLWKQLRTLQLYHAVTVAGIKVEKTHVPTPLPEHSSIDDESGDLVSLFVHDDRHGPYLRADLQRETNKLELKIDMRHGNTDEDETWLLTHILVPMHAKIRLSFGVLRDLAISVAKDVEALKKSYFDNVDPQLVKEPSVLFGTLINRAHLYTEKFFLGKKGAKVERLSNDIVMSRYVGVIRFSASYFGSFDLLIDTTSTPKNIHCLGLISTGKATRFTKVLGEILAGHYDCPLIL